VTNQPIKVGVVGVGHLGRLHVKQLKQVGEAAVAGIYDIDRPRLKEISKEFSVNPFQSFTELVDASDAIVIATPTQFHFDYAKESLGANRHIFIEKPITESVEQADDLIRLNKERNLKLQVGHIERFNPAIIALEPLKINPLFIESHRLSNFDVRGTDVAVVMDLMIHDIDLILNFVHSPVKNVDASGVSVISSTEDIANCRLQFENGCVANVTASRISARSMRKMRFFQPDAYVSIDFLEGSADVYYIENKDIHFPDAGLAFSLGKIDKGTEKKKIRYAKLTKKKINPLRYELQLFCQSIINDTEPPISGEAGKRALLIARLILESIDKHTKIVRDHWKI
jgi:predicted dehydrogenase